MVEVMKEFLVNINPSDLPDDEKKHRFQETIEFLLNPTKNKGKQNKEGGGNKKG